MAEPFIRRYEAEDRDDVAHVCLLTGDSGTDARGLHRDDSIVADVFCLPYLEYAPDLAFVVDDGTGTAVGYIIGVADTDAFSRWFVESWWPPLASRYPVQTPPADLQDQWATDASTRRTNDHPEYPAHLHIDLLPAVQGRGFGRALVETFLDTLRDRGVPGVHLGARADNDGALAFYPRVGFEALPPSDGVVTFVRRL